jgi:hypothetical protein
MLYLLVRGMAGVLYMVDVEVVGLFVNTQRSRPGHLRDFLAPALLRTCVCMTALQRSTLASCPAVWSSKILAATWNA